MNIFTHGQLTVSLSMDCVGLQCPMFIATKGVGVGLSSHTQALASASGTASGFTLREQSDGKNSKMRPTSTKS